MVEFGELDGTTSKAHAAKLKSSCRTSEDHIRGLYKRSHTKHPRRTVFCGTVNDPSFLRDISGNTRFGVVAIEEAFLDAQRKIDMRQLWAELVVRCEQELARDLARAEGFARPWLFTREQIRRIEAVNEEHRMETPVEQELKDLFDWSSEDRSNLMLMTEIRALMSARLGRGQDRGLSEMVRKLTGQRSAFDTSRTTVEGGVKSTRKGKFWGMPPKNEAEVEAVS